jgi:hypothetical protein
MTHVPMNLATTIHHVTHNWYLVQVSTALSHPYNAAHRYEGPILHLAVVLELTGFLDASGGVDCVLRKRFSGPIDAFDGVRPSPGVISEGEVSALVVESGVIDDI